LAKITASRVLFGIATFFFFLGFVVFEGLKITFFENQVNPYVVMGFAFAFTAFIAEFNGQFKKFFGITK
jgi:hypothetical protein